MNNAGNKPNEASGSDRYLPITIIDRRQLFEDGSSLRIQDAIEIKSEQLANVLDSNSTSQKMLSYCFREVIRNVFEHAQVNECVFMAQKYPNDNTVEIVILDKGIGIFHSLTSRYRDLLSVDQALNKCIEPGISRVAKSYIQDEWTNTGFGLYVLSSLGRSAGQFLICSNRRFLNLYNNLPPDIGGISFDGTVIQLIIKLHNVVQFPILLQKIVDEGVRLCKSKTGMNQNVSAKSKMVR